MRVQRGFAHRLAAVLAKAAAISACIVAGTGQAASAAPPSTVTVMTRNVYFGADLLPIASATTLQEVIDAASAIFASVQATNFPERARALADEIVATRPDLVGLQEMALWRTRFPATFPPSLTPTAEDVEFDFLALLQQELAARHARYEAVAVRVDNDVQVPADAPGRDCIFSSGFFSGACRDLRFTDRTVILARRHPPGPRVHTSNIQTKTFDQNVMLPILGGVVATRKGWLSVDVQLRGRKFRFITAHLQPGVDPIQEAQAAEIVAGPANTGLPVIFVCDCNSPADGSGSSTYDDLVDAGFADAWAPRFLGDPGSTCCQDADLRNEPSALSERLDLVLFKGPFAVTDVDIVGDDPADKTPSLLWPSDHAGVVGKLRQTHSR